MNRIIFREKNLDKNRLKDIYLEESLRMQGLSAHTIKHTIYKCEKNQQFDSIDEMKAFIIANPTKIQCINYLHVVNSKAQSETVNCQVNGSLYVVRHTSLFLVNFSHQFFIETVPATA